MFLFLLKKALNLFSKLEINLLEKNESIELLRFLEDNIKVKAVHINGIGLAVDYRSDIKQVENYIKKK